MRNHVSFGVQPSALVLDRRQFTVGASGLLSRAQISPPLQTAERFNSLGGEESSPCSGLPEPIILPPTSFCLILLSVCPYLFSLNKWRDFISDRLNTPRTRRSLWHAFLVCLQDTRNFWSTLLNITKCVRSCRLHRFLFCRCRSTAVQLQSLLFVDACGCLNSVSVFLDSYM